MFKTRTEQEWVYDYVSGKTKLLPIVLGTRGTWSANGKPMIILIGFTMIDVLSLGDIYGVDHHPVREMNHQGITYYAINITNKKRVKEIINEWKEIKEPLSKLS